MLLSILFVRAGRRARPLSLCGMSLFGRGWHACPPFMVWRMPRARLPLKNERRQTALQKAAKRTVESHLSHRERWPFAKPVFLFLFMKAFLSCCAAAWQHVISYLDQLRPKSVRPFILNCVDLQRKCLRGHEKECGIAKKSFKSLECL